MRISAHFTTDESSCSCGCGFGSRPSHVSAELLVELELMRAALARPVYVSSWCRCPTHNQNVGGVENSAHTRGSAADIRCHGGTERAELVFAAILARLVRLEILQASEARAAFLLMTADPTGLGVARSFVHVDRDRELVPRPAVWSY